MSWLLILIPSLDKRRRTPQLWRNGMLSDAFYLEYTTLISCLIQMFSSRKNAGEDHTFSFVQKNSYEFRKWLRRILLPSSVLLRAAWFRRKDLLWHQDSLLRHHDSLRLSLILWILVCTLCRHMILTLITFDMQACWHLLLNNCKHLILIWITFGMACGASSWILCEYGFDSQG